MSFIDQTAAREGSIPFINDFYLADEETLVRELAGLADPGDDVRAKIEQTAAELVRAVRKNTRKDGGIEAFLKQYDLSSAEGVLLMCIAEALLRIPDADTADRLIADKISAAKWQDHLGTSDSLFVNASTWGLMLTGQILALDDIEGRSPTQLLGKLVSRAGEPVVRTAMRQAMKIMGHQFVMGRTIGEALKRSLKNEKLPYRYSFDMLGESALTAADASRYLENYHAGIKSIGSGPQIDAPDVFSAPGISVKLSALHPRYEFSHVDRVMAELVPAVLELAQHAKDIGIGLTLDSEEASRLEMWLEIFERVYRDPSLTGWDGFGLAVQTYQRRGRDVLRFIESLAGDVGKRIPIRLVKGAYWDSEVKWAQEQGLESYPVFTRKAHSDVSYLACARQALAAGDKIYAQFATHNAHTLASVLHFAGARRDYEFQRAWARNSTPKWSTRKSTIARAACTHRSAITRTCCPTWCGACSKTAPTPRSSIASWTRQSASRTSSRIPLASRAATISSRMHRFRAPRTSSSPNDVIRAALTSQTATSVGDYWLTCRPRANSRSRPGR